VHPAFGCKITGTGFDCELSSDELLVRLDDERHFTVGFKLKKHVLTIVSYLF
jgi:hypothetical protein